MLPVGGMYKDLEPMRFEHCGQRHVFFRSASKVYLKFPKFSNYYHRNIDIFDNYDVLECFWKKKFEILGKIFVCKQTLDA